MSACTDPAADRDAAVRVMVVDEDPKTRAALGLLLSASPGFTWAGAFASVGEAARVSREPPNVALVALDLAEQAGRLGIAALRARLGDVPVLLLTVFEDEERLFCSLCGGASGYILKTTPPRLLLGQLREAATGGAPMSPEIATRALRLLRQGEPGERPTAAEAELLRLLAQGHGYREAAVRLGVTADSLRQHIRCVYAKLHRHTRPGRGAATLQPDTSPATSGRLDT